MKEVKVQEGNYFMLSVNQWQSQTCVTLKCLLLSTMPSTYRKLQQLETPARTHTQHPFRCSICRTATSRGNQSHQWLPPSGTEQWPQIAGAALPASWPRIWSMWLATRWSSQPSKGDARLHTPMCFFLSDLSFVDICFTHVIVPRMLANMLSKSKKIPFHSASCRQLPPCWSLLSGALGTRTWIGPWKSWLGRQNSILLSIRSLNTDPVPATHQELHSAMKILQRYISHSSCIQN